MNKSHCAIWSEIARIFRRCLSAVLLCLLVFSSACADDGNNPAPDERKEIVIGSDDYRPFFFVNEDGEFSGLDVEIATEAFGRMGYKAKFIQIEWSKKDVLLEEDVKKGGVNCLWGCFTMTGREETYAWAGPYMNSTQSVLVRHSDNIKTLADLNGKTVAVQATSKPDEIFSEMIATGELNLKNLMCFTSIDNVFASLRKGYADAIAGHMTAIKERIKNYPDDKYDFLDEPLVQVRVGVAFSKISSDSSIVSGLTETLENMTKDGSLQSILENYGVDAKYALDGIKGYE